MDRKASNEEPEDAAVAQQQEQGLQKQLEKGKTSLCTGRKLDIKPEPDTAPHPRRKREGRLKDNSGRTEFG